MSGSLEAQHARRRLHVDAKILTLFQQQRRGAPIMLLVKGMRMLNPQFTVSTTEGVLIRGSASAIPCQALIANARQPRMPTMYTNTGQLNDPANASAQ